jgi:hypothetical protein
MSVDYRTGRVTMTDVVAWPLPEWDPDGTCEIAIDRVTLRSGALDEPDRLRLKAQLTGTSFPLSCLPEEPREGLGMVGIEAIDMPRMTLDVDYGLPASDVTLRLFADITDVAVADLTADFAYFWFDGRDDMEEPIPVAFLDSATLTLENRGIWQSVQGMLPPPMTAENSGMFLEGMIGEGLADENPDGEGLTDSQRAFARSVAETWPKFLENPATLVLETGNESDEFLDFIAMEDDLRIVFDTLQPRLSLSPARRGEMLPLDLVSAAMGDGLSGLSDEDRRWVGMALVSGEGAPRFVARGADILTEFAESADGPAALALSEAMEARDPAAAYRWALLAGETGEAGATARLDRLERKLGFAEVIALQLATHGDELELDPAYMTSVAAIRDQAAMRLSGRGKTRSYAFAATWATLGRAAGDAESADILAEIDERVRLSGGAEAWAGHEADLGGIAMDAWIAQDLPASLGAGASASGGGGSDDGAPERKGKK